VRPALHIEDRDPIPEEQVKGSGAGFPLKKRSLCNLPAFTSGGMGNIRSIVEVLLLMRLRCSTVSCKLM
jgi:hypothetical protein